MTAVRRARLIYIMYSLVLIVLGIFLIIRRNMNIDTISKLIGGVVIVCGIVRILLYYVNDTYGLAFQFDFALGIFSIVIGLILMTQPLDTLEHLNVITGIFIIADGSFKLQTSGDARKFGMKYWIIILVLAVITTLCGLSLAINQVSKYFIPIVMIGCALTADGIENLYIATYTVKLVKRFRHKGKIMNKGAERDD